MASEHEMERLATLRGYRILGTQPDALFETLTKIAAETFNASSSLLSLVDDGRQWFLARHGFARGDTGLDENICVQAIRGSDILVIEDASTDPRCVNNPLVQTAGIGFYAGAPLIAANGHCIGMLCVCDSKPKAVDKWQIDALGNLAKLAMGLLEARKSEIELKDEKEHLLRIADNSPGGLFEFAMDANGHQWLKFASAGIRDTIGVSPEDALCDIRNVFRNIHPDDVADCMASVRSAYRTRGRWRHQFRVNHPIRGIVWLFGMSQPANADDGVLTWQGFLMDITDYVAEQERLAETRAEMERQYRELQEYQKLFTQIGQMAKVGACAVDLKEGTVTWTPELYTMHGVGSDFQPTLENAIGFCDANRRDELSRRVSKLTELGGKLRIEYPITAANGRRRWLRAIAQTEYDENNAPSRLIGSLQDVTNERSLLERVRYHATHDHLTRLANRSTFFNQLSALLSRSEPNDVHALVFIDLDHFKDINDAFGYECGDRVITVIGQRLKAIVERLGGRSQVARFGGDEFAVLLADLNVPEAVEPLARSIVEEIGSPVIIAGRSVPATVSMGISIYPEDGDDTVSLFRKADLALRHSKKAGGARVANFAQSMEDEASADQLIKSDMLRGLQAGEFEVHYQPIVDLSTRALDGFEALLRWRHPHRGLVTAGVFAHLLDDPTIGGHLSTIVIDQVTGTIRDWSANSLTFGRIAINITSSQLRNPFFERQLKNLVRRGIPPEYLKLEITEGVLLGRTADKAAQVLTRIRQMGFSIALDDFGTGYASLVHLTAFPIDQIKIDMSFVRKIASSENDRTIVQTMCALANGLGLTAVAEGIEDAEVEQMLRLMGCRYGQGYLYAKALPRDEAETFVRGFVQDTGERPVSGVGKLAPS